MGQLNFVKKMVDTMTSANFCHSNLTLGSQFTKELVKKNIPKNKLIEEI